MSYQGPQVFKDAVAELARLPGVGEKTAKRLVFHLIKHDSERVKLLTQSLINLKNQLLLCEECFGYADEKICVICKDPTRDQQTICVVEDPSDLFAIEATLQYRGAYHVLHGRLSPLEGIGPGQLKTAELIARVKKIMPKEIILAMNPDVEGDATAIYFSRVLAEYQIATSRLAMGIPMGGNLEYTDQVTIGRALMERRRFTTSLP